MAHCLSLSKARLAARPSTAAASRLHSVRPVVSICRSTPQQVSAASLEAAKKADETCETGTAKDCAVAWDEVEELSAAASHMKSNQYDPSNDPLERYCEDNPETDECRIYED